MMNRSIALACCALLALTACNRQAVEQTDAGSAALDCPPANESGVIEIAPGLTATITNNGHGRAAVAGDFAEVHTTLWLFDENAAGGRGTEIWASEE